MHIVISYRMHAHLIDLSLVAYDRVAVWHRKCARWFSAWYYCLYWSSHWRPTYTLLYDFDESLLVCDILFTRPKFCRLRQRRSGLNFGWLLRYRSDVRKLDSSDLRIGKRKTVSLFQFAQHDRIESGNGCFHGTPCGRGAIGMRSTTSICGSGTFQKPKRGRPCD